MVNLCRKDQDNGLRAAVLGYLSLIKKVCAGDQNRADFLLDRFREQAAEGLQNGGSTLASHRFALRLAFAHSRLVLAVARWLRLQSVLELTLEVVELVVYKPKFTALPTKFRSSVSEIWQVQTQFR